MIQAYTNCIIDKGIRIYKSSTLGQATGCSTPGPSLPIEGVDQPDWNVDVSERLVGKDDVIPGGRYSLMTLRKYLAYIVFR